MATSSMILLGLGMLAIAALIAIPGHSFKKGSDLLSYGESVISEGITSVAFLIIFVVFMSQIIARYFFKTSIPWSNEISILGYMYCMYFGSGRALAKDEHVVFSLVYDKLPAIGQLVFKLIYNIAMIVLLALTIKPSFDAIMKMKNVTPSLQMPYKVVFFPYIWFLIETIIRCAFYIKDSIVEYKSKKEVAK